MTYSGSTVPAEEMTVGKEGAQLFRAALSTTQMGEIEGALAAQPRDYALECGSLALKNYGRSSIQLDRSAKLRLRHSVRNAFHSAQYFLTRAQTRTGLWVGIRTARLQSSSAWTWPDSGLAASRAAWSASNRLSICLLVWSQCVSTSMPSTKAPLLVEPGSHS